MSYGHKLQVKARWFPGLTLSLQDGELLGQGVLTLLQLPLLLLHVLHVVAQRLDLGLVLRTEGTTSRGTFYFPTLQTNKRSAHNTRIRRPLLPMRRSPGR